MGEAHSPSPLCLEARKPTLLLHALFWGIHSVLGRKACPSPAISFEGSMSAPFPNASFPLLASFPSSSECSRRKRCCYQVLPNPNTEKIKK